MNGLGGNNDAGGLGNGEELGNWQTGAADPYTAMKSSTDFNPQMAASLGWENDRVITNASQGCWLTTSYT